MEEDRGSAGLCGLGCCLLTLAQLQGHCSCSCCWQCSQSLQCAVSHVLHHLKSPVRWPHQSRVLGLNSSQALAQGSLLAVGAGEPPLRGGGGGSREEMALCKNPCQNGPGRPSVRPTACLHCSLNTDLGARVPSSQEIMLRQSLVNTNRGYDGQNHCLGVSGSCTEHSEGRALSEMLEEDGKQRQLFVAFGLWLLTGGPCPGQPRTAAG